MEGGLRVDPAMTRQRRAIEATYTDTCSVYGFDKMREDGITKELKVMRFENIKCALSQKSLKPTAQTGTVNNISYDAKLFTAPEHIITPGCEIRISRLGREYRFKSTGEAFVYETHQEIMLLRDEKA